MLDDEMKNEEEKQIERMEQRTEKKEKYKRDNEVLMS